MPLVQSCDLNVLSRYTKSKVLSKREGERREGGGEEGGYFFLIVLTFPVERDL